MPGRSTNLDNGRARAYCACSRCGWGLFGYIFLSPFISLSFFFLPLSGMNGWVICGLSPFQQNFSDTGTLGWSWVAVCNGIPFKIAKISASGGSSNPGPLDQQTIA